MQQITLTINPTLDVAAITNLRESVGWDRQDEDYPAALDGCWATVGGFAPTGELIAWCAVISDGVRHAVLLDVIVHPIWQRKGIGQALVKRAIEHIQADHISIIHVDFLPEHTDFYARCGFSIGLGGIIGG